MGKGGLGVDAIDAVDGVAGGVVGGVVGGVEEVDQLNVEEPWNQVGHHALAVRLGGGRQAVCDLCGN